MDKKPGFRLLAVFFAFIVGMNFLFLLLTNGVDAKGLNSDEPFPVYPTQPESESYLVLSFDPVEIAVGDIFTLHIEYYNIGLHFTSFNITPTNVITFDPPLSSCNYSDPGGCRAVTFRALTPGTAHISAFATGEIYDDSCGCWRWSGAASREPATVIIGGTHIYLPVVYRDQ